MIFQKNLDEILSGENGTKVVYFQGYLRPSMGGFDKNGKQSVGSE